MSRRVGQLRSREISEQAWKALYVCGLIILALLAPPFSYLVWPFYQDTYPRERIVRVEYDHDYYGSI